jgi:hypothetical protein
VSKAIPVTTGYLLTLLIRNLTQLSAALSYLFNNDDLRRHSHIDPSWVSALCFSLPLSVVITNSITHVDKISKDMSTQSKLGETSDHFKNVDFSYKYLLILM